MNNRILIVEDEAYIRDVLCDYFRSKGALKQIPKPEEEVS